MSTRNTTPTGSPCWLELATSDPDRSRAFYGELFRWTSTDAGEELGGYINFSRDGAAIAGGMRNDPSWATPDGWSVYLSVTDAQATVDAATAQGSEVQVAPMAVAALGTMAVITDPGGASVGLWQADEFAGYEVFGEAGTPVHFELHTRDYDVAVAFYRDVLGWDAQTEADVPGFRYTTDGQGDGQRAGIMDASAMLPEGVGAHWAIYFGVDDIDKALAQVEDLGGSVVTPAMDTPYGRLATAADPTGAEFRLRADS